MAIEETPAGMTGDRNGDSPAHSSVDGSHADSEILYPELPEISREELRRRLRDPALTVVDIHAPDVYAAEHLPGAVPLPLSDIQARASAVLPRRDAEIAVYCSAYT
jgi:hypothetical protein